MILILSSLVAINKSENDEKFASTLQELRNSFPRIQLAENIYSDISVKEKVSKVYSQVINFGREATDYFLARSTGRSEGKKMLHSLMTFSKDT